MKKYLLIILLLLSSSIYGQDISVETQKYYVSANRWDVDTICSLVYQVRNVSSTPQVLLFTEDDVNSMPLKTLIKKKLKRRYGDFSLAFFLWDANIENNSDYVNVPSFFVKFLSPDESFNITLSFQNENDHRVDSLFRKHLLICNLNTMSICPLATWIGTSHPPTGIFSKIISFLFCTSLIFSYFCKLK